ncbi:MAG: hypothetical protein QOE28_2918 [Solirubrobacteraceae bacterium]|nr:hypothetical protein [Solirubrobacteraceae bacterium]
MIDGMARLAGALGLVVLVAAGIAILAPGHERAQPPRAASPRSAAPRAATAAPPAAAAPRGPVTRQEIAVIRGWSDTLRAGDVEAASRYWAPPAVASNGGEPYDLRTMAAVRYFNESLPCGARLESTERVQRRLVMATFRLTERRGGTGCGSGVGQRVRTVFLIQGGKIKQWIRASDPAPASQQPGGTQS